MDIKIQKRLEDMPESYRANYLKAVEGKSRPCAVKAMCLECMGWQRIEVKNCPSIACPLYNYRPYRR